MAAFSASAFSVTSFSEAAFDFGGVVPPLPEDTVLGGGGEWRHGGFRTASDEYRERKALLKEVEQEIAVIEQEEKPLIKKAKRNTDAEIKLAAIREQIIALRLEREALIRMIDDEEAIFILLAATPFN